MGTHSAERTDTELVREALARPDAYAAIVERYHAPLLRYVARLGCRDRDDAADILQEAFIKAYVNLNGYDQALKFSSWLYRIVHNETMSHYRKVNARPPTATSEDQLLFFESVRDELDVEHETDRVIVAEQVAAALGALEPKYREPLVLRYLEEKSYDEIADILRLPMGTVATLIRRGKERLKEMLAPHAAGDRTGDRINA